MAHASTAPVGRLSRGRVLVSALVLGAAGLLASAPAQARDTQHFLPIMPVMASTAASQRLGKDVAFFFGDKQPYERIEKRGWARVNPKTNATNKSNAAAGQLGVPGRRCASCRKRRGNTGQTPSSTSAATMTTCPTPAARKYEDAMRAMSSRASRCAGIW